MEKTKLVSALRLIPAAEAKSFHNWLKTTDFGDEGRLCILLVKSIRKDNVLTREQAYSNLFKSSKFDDAKLRRLTNRSFRLFEKFLVYRELELDTDLQERLLLGAFRKYHLASFFVKHCAKMKKEIDNAQIRDSEFCLHRFLTEMENSRFLDQQNDRSVEPNLQVAMDALDQFYYGSKLALTSSMKNHAAVSNFTYRTDHLNKLLNQAYTANLKPEPLVVSYEAILSMLNSPEDRSVFNKALQVINRNAEFFSKLEARDLYLYAANICIKNVVAGDESWLNELSSVYRKLLELDLLLEEGFLSPWTFKNIAAAGIRLGDYDWVEQFLANYGEKLDHRYRENALKYNEAYLQFARGEYKEVIITLQVVEYQDVFYALDVRALLMKTYFNLGEYETLLALCESFRLFVLRHSELGKTRKQNFGNLIRMIRLTVKAKLAKDSDGLEQLISELEDGMVVSDKNWLRYILQKTIEEI